MTSRSAELMESFVELTNALLAEEAQLVQVTAEPRYTQATGRARGSAARSCVPGRHGCS